MRVRASSQAHPAHPATPPHFSPPPPCVSFIRRPSCQPAFHPCIIFKDVFFGKCACDCVLHSNTDTHTHTQRDICFVIAPYVCVRECVECVRLCVTCTHSLYTPNNTNHTIAHIHLKNNAQQSKSPQSGAATSNSSSSSASVPPAHQQAGSSPAPSRT